MADNARKQIDKDLSELEKRIKEEYEKAAKEMDKKIDSYLKRYETLDAQKRKAVANGSMTEKEYRQWRTNTMLTTERWKDMREVLAKDLGNYQAIAKSMTTQYAQDAYALGHNYTVESVMDGFEFRGTYSIYNRNAVESLMRRDSTVLPLPGEGMKKKLAEEKAQRWREGQIQSVAMQAILQGESIPEISKRIAETLGVKGTADSIRYARTAMTSAENKGRLDGMQQLADDGVILEKRWMATGDDRTRQSHLDIDGEGVPPNEEFSNGLMYPGDPAGAADEVWNCRCTMGTYVIGFRRKDGSISYVDYEEVEESQHEREIAAEKARRGTEFERHTVVDGTDISQTWTRREDLFAFEIEDVINAQGFDGLPRVVSADEFDKLVKEANSGNGFVAQRTYSAPDKEILDAYRDQLYNGKWYVDCSTGGAQYGQGMYCAADYNGILSDGIKAEMDHYRSLRQSSIDGETISYNKLNFMIQDKIQEQEGLSKTKARFALMKELNSGVSQYDIAKKYGINIERSVSYTETLTLDPSAKIITWKEIDRMMSLDKEHDYEWFKAINWDEGVYAALKGYDAINAEGHGESKSYTVILNRTKLIIKGE